MVKFDVRTTFGPLFFTSLVVKWNHTPKALDFNPSLAEHDMPLANSVDPDQLASEANWSGSALLVKYVNFYQKPGSSNLIGLKLEVGVAS